MARVKISEYRAKKILLGDAYKGVSVRVDEKTVLPKSGMWVAKVDQGVKKRFKQGLVVVGVSPAEAQKKLAEWSKSAQGRSASGGKGFSQFLLEPMVAHETSEEQYFALVRVREGIRMLHTRDGGVDIEAHPENVQTYIISNNGDVQTVATAAKIPPEFLQQVVDSFDKNFFAFLEINPLVVQGSSVHLLDAACLVDDAGAYFVDSWSTDDIVKTSIKHLAEAAVEEIAKTTPASLKLSVINPNGSLFLLLSGGGGSIVIADEAQLEGVGDMLGNYGEYSGGPTRQETYLYAKEVIELMLASKSKKRALVIAGGIANFTDVQKTFAGIIDALSEVAPRLRKAGIRVFVRRGGPNEKAGLALMRQFLEREQLLGSIYGSDTIITKAVEDAIAFARV